ncbi:MAG: glycosyltransferase family 4 protein [Prevotella sp.]|nr:glycosyltransferase family 4 protein [Prevotella sp.]
MNIGIVTTWFERGAAYVSRQFEEVLEKENNVFIFARGGEKYAKGDPNWDHPNVTWSTRCDRLVLMSFLKEEFVKWVKDNSIELVIFNEQRYYQPLLWCKDLNVKTVAYIDYYTEGTLPLFRAYDALICNTKRHYMAFESFGNAYYVPWGTNVDLFKPKGDGLVRKNVVTFFHSGGVKPTRKGTDVFIEALAGMKNDFYAVIHTQSNLKKCFPQLTNTIDNLVKNGKLEIIEKTVPAPGLYYMGDVYVYPSTLEGIGLTIAESISSGLACVVTDNPPMNEFVRQEFGSTIPIDKLYFRSDGYYWPKCHCNVNALSRILDEYAANPDMVADKKQKARSYAEENLSFDKNTSNLSELLKNVSLKPETDELRNMINRYDRRGKQLLHPLFIKLGLYKYIQRNRY